jgi:hypothetical protein
MTDFQQSLRGTMNDPLFRAAGGLPWVGETLIDALGVLALVARGVGARHPGSGERPARVASTVRSWGPFVNVACAPAALIEHVCAAPQLHVRLASGGVRI